MISLDNGRTFVQASELSEEAASRVLADMEACAHISLDLRECLEILHGCGLENAREFVEAYDAAFPGWVVP